MCGSVEAERVRRYWVVVRNPRIWIYLVVGLVAAGLIGYSEWRDPTLNVSSAASMPP